MSLGGLSFGKIVQRFLLYVGVAFVVLAVFFAFIVLSKGAKVPWQWVALTMWTALLFWITIRQSRAYWRHVGFWLTIAGLLVVHLLFFIAILRVYPQWREIWYWPIVVVEGGFFGAILYLLFGRFTSRKPRNERGRLS
jgi:hypothetical protein